MRSRDLDFIVIGVQKGGTTSLWQHLRQHPKIALPDYKEAPIFASQERVPQMLANFMKSNFGDVASDVILGKAATHYMMGQKPVDVELIAERIAQALPDVRLIALLRDPIERAMSQYTMLARWGREGRSFDGVVDELLKTEQLEIARTQPTETNSYLVQGEYARILQSYFARFPAKRIHVENTIDLARQPGQLIDRVLAFLRLPPGYRPPGLEIRHFKGGARPRLDAAGEEQLRAFMEEVWPKLEGRGLRVRLAFEFFMKTWNVISDDRKPPFSDKNRGRLEAHYREDGRLLAKLGIQAPWLDSWNTFPPKRPATPEHAHS